LAASLGMDCFYLSVVLGAAKDLTLAT